MIRQLVGDCRVQLATLDPESVQAVATSPPYYGLRDYGTDPLVWGGDPEHAHNFTETQRYFENRKAAAVAAGIETKGELGGVTPGVRMGAWRYGDCPCGAWLGSLGLEPTPELYIEHLVEVFRGVRRVLRPDGLLWLNLGDSYAGSGKGPTGHNGIGNQAERQGFANGTGVYWCPDCNITRHISVLTSGCPQCGETMVPTAARRGWDKSDSNRGSQKYALVNGGQPPAGLKPKDLMMMPARVAMALQADGWWLRSMIPWLKRNSMPESVTDRPATAVE